MAHPCAICGQTMTPFTPGTMTAHEFYCYKLHPLKVPPHHATQFKSTLAWEARSLRAKLVWAKRKQVAHDWHQRYLNPQR